MLSTSLEVKETSGALKINTVLEELSDKGWHRIDELSASTCVDRDKVLKIVNFFRDYGFIEISMSGETVKLDKDYVDLYRVD
jgi:transcription initiation factor IIE alpha subunit